MRRAEVVWKYVLGDRPGTVEISMPVGAQVLSAGVDPATGEVAIWAQVDPSAPMRPRTFPLTFTGDVAPDGARAFIGTVVIGPYVYHVWARP